MVQKLSLLSSDFRSAFDPLLRLLVAPSPDWPAGVWGRRVQAADEAVPAGGGRVSEPQEGVPGGKKRGGMLWTKFVIAIETKSMTRWLGQPLGMKLRDTL